MTFDVDRHKVGRDKTRQVVLDVDGEQLELTVRPLPWSKKRQIASQSVRWDQSGETTFDGDFYIKEVLKYVIVSAPWGQTTELFLNEIDEALGSALETLVPSATDRDTGAPDPDTVKKDS